MDISGIKPVTDSFARPAEAAQASNHNFLLRVQASIGPKSLPGNGLTGRVLVAFSISNDGSLLGVRLAQSSGHDRLDQQAVQIVAKAAFPTPPLGLSIIGRTYVSAFTFS